MRPGTIENPRSIRLAISVENNQKFPSVFENNCRYGIADNMVGILSQATLSIPKSKRAELANSKPVAFVQECKHLIADVLSILLRVKVEDSGYYSRFDGQSSRKTQYYKTKKGIFGHTFAVAGVMEAHEKGTLHWHFTIYAGLSPYILQCFAHLQDICDKISSVLDGMYCSHGSHV
jgi:hypothetical protein